MSEIAPPSAELFPGAELRQARLADLDAKLAPAVAAARSGRVSPMDDRDAFSEALAAFDFASPRRWEEVMAWTVAALRDGTVHTPHPSYFGLFNPCPTLAAEAADRITAAFNPQLAARSHAPASVDIEAHVAEALARRLGRTADIGHFTSGGTEANFTAVVCALTRAEPGFGDKGVRAFDGAPTLYASRESHLAWLKIAHQVGIGREAVRLVATDGLGRMSAEALKAAIAEDRAAGRTPVMIAATAGTTNAGMIDPLAACADIAAEASAWLHVDAAWAGALCSSPRLAGALAGIELADSVTVDAHKWFASTMGAGVFMTSHPDVVREAFRVEASYMPSADRTIDPYLMSVQWSRRLLGLRLFMTLAVAGWDGLAAHVERCQALAERLAADLEARGWRVVNASPAALVCAVPPEHRAPVRAIVDRTVGSGEAWVSVAVFEGGEVVRACITNGATLPEDVDALAARLDSESKRTA